jgi:hypothetical protein
MVGNQQIPQNVAQAAMWNVANGVSWPELAAKNRVELKTVNYFERYFSPLELATAMQVVSEADRRAEGVYADQQRYQTEDHQRNQFPGVYTSGSAAAAFSVQSPQ